MRKLPHKCTGMGLHSAILVSFTISFVAIFMVKKKKLQGINYAKLSCVETTQRICGTGLKVSLSLW